MSDLLKKPGFIKLLFSKPQISPESYLSDVYDGSFYKSFLDRDGNHFFSDKRNIGLMLNFDFFNPFKNSQYSLGVIYAVLLNLPRDVRFLWENVIIVGIIPGPKEPKKTINSFLKPFVDELMLSWSPGIIIQENGLNMLYRFALVCVSSDLPAFRKCAGFLSHNATKGMG